MSIGIKHYSVYLETEEGTDHYNSESREEAMDFINDTFKKYGVDSIVSYKLTESSERLLLIYER